MDAVAIGLKQNGEWVAGVIYDHYNTVSVAMHVAATGRDWLNREFLRICFDYPFNQLKVKKIIGLVDESNHQARKFDEHLGFRLEAVIEDACKGGQLLIYTMTRQECRFIGENHGIKKFTTARS